MDFSQFQVCRSVLLCLGRPQFLAEVTGWATVDTDAFAENRSLWSSSPPLEAFFAPVVPGIKQNVANLVDPHVILYGDWLENNASEVAKRYCDSGYNAVLFDEAGVQQRFWPVQASQTCRIIFETDHSLSEEKEMT